MRLAVLLRNCLAIGIVPEAPAAGHTPNPTFYFCAAGNPTQSLVHASHNYSPSAAQALGQGSKESLLGGQREGSMGECTLLAAPVEEQNSVPSI